MSARTAAGHRVLRLRLVRDDDLGGEEQRRDGCRVLQGRAGHLDRVVDARGEQVLVDAGRGVEAVTRRRPLDLLDNDAALKAGVDGDLAQRGGERQLDDASAGGLVALELEALERVVAGLDQRDATTGDDALFDGSLRVANGVLDAVLALLELDLGRRARLDDGDAARELGEALLELLAVVVGVGVLDLRADLLDATLDDWPASPAPSTMVVSSLVTTTLRAWPSRSSVAFSSERPTDSEMTWPPVRIAMSWSIALRRSPKPGALTATALNVPRILFTTSVARASPSTSSEMIASGLPACMTFSSSGSRSLMFEIFDSTRST